MKFRTTILQAGKTATGIRVPAEVVESMGAGKQPRVKVTIKGFTYRSAIAVMGGDYMVGVNAENRAAAGVAGGDEVEVDIVLDTEPRVVTVPPDLVAALEKEPKAKQYFEVLSPYNRKRHVQLIESAKTDETRQRRIEKAVGLFREGKN